jgi:hypothetical protein
MYDKLMSYLSGKGMQPAALERLIRSMEQTRGTAAKPVGYQGNKEALRGANLQFPMRRPR